MTTQSSYSIAIHGGAGNDRQQSAREARIEDSLLSILTQGRAMLDDGAAALDTVVHCTRLLEDDPLYNAGYGAVPNCAGRFELEASVMDGRTLKAGAVTNVDNIRNPVDLARRIMDETAHIMLAGQGAADFAAANGLASVSQTYFQEGWRKHATTDKDTYGTVGAVARDRHGNLAAATSTGGQAGKLPGRVGDSPLIGAGNSADNEGCAVSCTGWGEDFMRTALAAQVCFLISRQGLDAHAAAHAAIEYLVAKVNGNGGFILVDRIGNIATAASSASLRCAWIEQGGEIKTALQASIRIARAAS
ncbi:MAG: isoaspartyl peptidase/L-asparaginase family protein [Nitrococcus sp.]|nr:isoaspartyl peptidase/L-asparaginase family protein [Nitrococcus sp.]